MATRFYFAYMGCKRAELQFIDDLKLNPDDYDIIVEPFAGSCALSLELASRPGWANKKFAICDLDTELIALWRYIRANGADSLYEYCATRLNDTHWLATREKEKKGEFLGPLDYFYMRKTGGHRGSMIMKPTRWSKLTKGPHHDATTAFFQSPNVDFILGDWSECIEKFANNPRALIFLDPPYFDSCNQLYQSMRNKRTDADGYVTDITGLYIEMREVLQNSLARVISITNGCEIMKYVFAPFIRSEYEKRYNTSAGKGADGKTLQRRTTHILCDSHTPPPP